MRRHLLAACCERHHQSAHLDGLTTPTPECHLEISTASHVLLQPVNQS